MTDELARRGALLVPSTISCSLSLLVSRIYSSLFSDWKHTVSSKFFDTQVTSISTEELVLPRHACCKVNSLLLDSYLSRISRTKNPSCSARGHLSSHSALSSYGLFVPLAFWRLSGPGPGKLPGLKSKTSCICDHYHF